MNINDENLERFRRMMVQYQLPEFKIEGNSKTQSCYFRCKNCNRLCNFQIPYNEICAQCLKNSENEKSKGKNVEKLSKPNKYVIGKTKLGITIRLLLKIGLSTERICSLLLIKDRQVIQYHKPFVGKKKWKPKKRIHDKIIKITIIAMLERGVEPYTIYKTLKIDKSRVFYWKKKLEKENKIN